MPTAISHLNKGLELVATLPDAQERVAAELALRSVLGTAWLALNGRAATEVWTHFNSALALARSLGRTDALAPIFWGLWPHVLCRGRIAESLDLVGDTLDAAEATGDSDLLIVGHMEAMCSYALLGELITTRRT
jgi:hypothetical protein